MEEKKIDSVELLSTKSIMNDIKLTYKLIDGQEIVECTFTSVEDKNE